MPDLGPGDLLEAILLRIPDANWKDSDMGGGLDFDKDGVPITGDPVIDEWERTAFDGRTRS